MCELCFGNFAWNQFYRCWDFCKIPHVPQMQDIVSPLVIAPWKRRLTSSSRIYEALVVHPHSCPFRDSICSRGSEGRCGAGLRRGCLKLQPSIPQHPLGWGWPQGQMQLLDYELVHTTLLRSGSVLILLLSSSGTVYEFLRSVFPYLLNLIPLWLWIEAVWTKNYLLNSVSPQQRK